MYYFSCYHFVLFNSCVGGFFFCCCCHTECDRRHFQSESVCLFIFCTCYSHMPYISQTTVCIMHVGIPFRKRTPVFFFDHQSEEMPSVRFRAWDVDKTAAANKSNVCWACGILCDIFLAKSDVHPSNSTYIFDTFCTRTCVTHIRIRSLAKTICDNGDVQVYCHMPACLLLHSFGFDYFLGKNKLLINTINCF